MSFTVNQNTLNNGVEAAKNVSRVLANLTDNKPKTQPEKKTENMNQPHTQTVEVKVGEQQPAAKPTIIKEKSETHVHKVFPDQRELSERECQVREMELKNEHELKMTELKYRIQLEEENRKERREREEYERKERERRRERERKYSRRVCIGMGVLGVAAIGCYAYDLYTNSRGLKGRRVALPDQPAPVQGTGSVE